MDVIKQWIICIIFCSLIGSLVNILSPNGGTKRAMKTVVAAFMIAAFLSPILGGASIETDFDFSSIENYQSSLTKDINKAMLENAEEQTKIKTEELLLSLNINEYEISAEGNINNNNEIYIECINLTLSEDFKYREKQITSNLKTMFAAEVVYIWVRE